MTPSQRYYQLMTPALILIGFFFGIPTLLVIFSFTVFVYLAHVYDWTIWQFTYRACLFLVLGSVLASYLSFGYHD